VVCSCCECAGLGECRSVTTRLTCTATALLVLQGPALEVLLAFNRERRQLVQELQSLRQQLEPEVDIPQLQPLRDETERLDQLLAALAQLQVGAMCAVTRRDTSAACHACPDNCCCCCCCCGRPLSHVLSAPTW
jgi:hypothetical protein